MSGGNVTVVTQAQLESIRAKISDPVKTNVAQERQRRKDLSTIRASKWPNTIEAQRERKERNRILQLEAAEAERVKEDQRREVIKAEERRMQIERANKMLYDQTDRVKAFHSKLLHSDVIKENEKQIDFKQHIATLKKDMDDQFLVQQRAALEIAEQKELEKMEERTRKALEQKAIQLQQLDEVKARLASERTQRMVEGQMLMEAAEREKKKEIEAALKRREESKQRNLDMLRANDALREYRRVQEEQERLADEQVAAYAARKAAMIEERKRRELQRQADKDAKRDRMIAYMEANLEEERKQNERLLKMQEDDSEAKRAADLAERNRQRMELQQAIDASRTQQLELRAAKKAKDRQDEIAYSAAWGQRLKELKEEDEQEKYENYMRKKHNQSLILRQIEMKARKKQAAKHVEMEEAFASKLALEEEDQMYDEYTQLCLEEWEKSGKSTLPMTLHLGKTRAATERGILPAVTNSFR